MSEYKKYFVVKDKKDEVITYFEYNKVNGYDLSPKKNLKIKDAIDVNKIIIINPSMIQKMVSKKLQLKFERFLKLLTVVFETDDESGETYRQAFNELSKLRLESQVKYKKYLKQEAVEVFEKKLDILELELKNHIYYIEEQNQDDAIRGKSR